MATATRRPTEYAHSPDRVSGVSARAVVKTHWSKVWCIDVDLPHLAALLARSGSPHARACQFAAVGCARLEAARATGAMYGFWRYRWRLDAHECALFTNYLLDPGIEFDSIEAAVIQMQKYLDHITPAAALVVWSYDRPGRVRS